MYNFGSDPNSVNGRIRVYHCQPTENSLIRYVATLDTSRKTLSTTATVSGPVLRPRLCLTQWTELASHSTDLSVMEGQLNDAVDSKPRVNATFHLGSERFSVCSNAGILSQQLVTMKDQSMAILKDYITKHNAPNDVPDEVTEGSSDESEDDLDNPPKKSKKQN
ncbi:hypothetical protein MUK42_21145 [Musa troglodytarum]|uniref:Uncharacterized protein n=1 Tax=Musa troglodytarum TaxID=320322 RepID=A0A9E7JYX8_9LILI|nr:hypothetical protein MUK42_21145 [Musa troglodytarum]